MKHRSFLFTVIAAVILIAVFVVYTYKNTSSPTSQDDEYYLSFTNLYILDEDKMEASVCEYNFEDKEISEIFRFPFNAMYPLGVYDKMTNSVFYSKGADNDTSERRHVGDQIWQHDLSTGTDTMLTEDLIAVNYIIPVDNMLFFLAATLDNSNLQVGKIDLSNGNIQYWDEAFWDTSRVLGIDREQERLYVALYNDEEERAGRSPNLEVKPNVNPTYTICSYDYNLENKIEILRDETMEIPAVYARDNVMLYRVRGPYTMKEPPYTHAQVIDLDTMEVLFEMDEEFSKNGCFSEDGAGVYTFETFGNLSYFDFETQEYTPLLQDIVNFQLMRGPK